MSDSRGLARVRTLHTAVYVVMVAAIVVLLYAAATGYTGVLLWVALCLLAAEAVVFVGNGFTCPLTKLAVRYGAQAGWAFDSFLPERATRYTFRFFGSLTLLGLVVLAARWAGVLG